MARLLSEILGNITSTGIVLLSQGTPESAILCSMLQPTLTRAFEAIISDIKEKRVSERQAERMSISYKSALDTINGNLESFTKLNSDLFSQESGFESKVYDILEDILINSKNDVENKKAEFYGCFFGNIVFSDKCNYRQIFVIQKLVPQLTYSHLCLMKLIHERSILKARNWRKHSDDVNAILVYHEIKELIQFDILTKMPPFIVGEELGNLKLSSLGEAIYTLLRLEQIQENDLKDSRDILKRMCQ